MNEMQQIMQSNEYNNMLEVLKNDLMSLFLNVQKTTTILEIREELLVNTEEHYRDLCSQGISPQQARNMVLQSLGNLDELFSYLENCKDEAAENAHLESLIPILKPVNTSQTEGQPLFNKSELSLENITELNIKYPNADLFLSTHNKETLIIVEDDGVYLPNLIASVINFNGALSIDGPKRRFFQKQAPTKVEIFLPETFHARLSLSSNTGDVLSTDALNLKSCHIASVEGDINVKEISVQDGLNLSSVNGKCKAGHMISGNKLILHSISGDIQAESLSGERIDVACTSGDIIAKSIAAIQCVSMKTVSGDIDCSIYKVVNESIQVSTVSGDICLGFFESGDYVVSSSFVSSSFYSDFVGIHYHNGGAEGVIGSGKGAPVHIYTVSGDLRLKKINKME